MAKLAFLLLAIFIYSQCDLTRSFELSEDEDLTPMKRLRQLKTRHHIGNKLLTVMKDFFTGDWSSKDDVYTHMMKHTIFLQGNCKLGDYYNATESRCLGCSTCSDRNLCRTLCNEHLINKEIEDRGDETKIARNFFFASIVLPCVLTIAALYLYFYIKHKIKGIRIANQHPIDDNDD